MYITSFHSSTEAVYHAKFYVNFYDHSVYCKITKQILPACRINFKQNLIRVHKKLKNLNAVLNGKRGKIMKLLKCMMTNMSQEDHEDGHRKERKIDFQVF
jgi:hypothetical protein